MSVAYSFQDNLIFTGAHDGSLIAWNFEAGNAKFYLHELDKSCLSTDPVMNSKSVDCLLVLDKRRILISGTADQHMRFWSTETGKKLNMVYANHQPDDALTSIATTEDNNFIITGDTSGRMKLFDITMYGFDLDKDQERFICVWFIQAHKKIINTISVAEVYGDKFIVTCSDDMNVLLHRFDGILIGQFTQEGSWNLKNLESYRHKQPNSVKIWHKMKKKKVQIAGFDEVDPDFGFGEPPEEDGDDMGQFGGLTLTSAGQYLSHKPKPYKMGQAKRRIKPINEDIYFQKISKNKPIETQTINKDKFFNDKFGKPHKYYKDLYSKNNYLHQ